MGRGVCASCAILAEFGSPWDSDLNLIGFRLLHEGWASMSLVVYQTLLA
jgi:hypothetical protein